MKKYKTKILGYKIEMVEVERETKSTVWCEYEWSGKKSIRQERKVTEYECYFDTWQEAKQHLLNHLDGRIEGVRGELEALKSRRGNVSGMKEPVESII